MTELDITFVRPGRTLDTRYSKGRYCFDARRWGQNPCTAARGHRIFDSCPSPVVMLVKL